MLKYILLGHLNDSPATGYEIKQALEKSTAYFWHAHHSQIYTTLRKLEEEGLISSYTEKNHDHLVRRIYSLTEAGKRELHDWLEEPLREIPRLKDDLLVRITHSGDRRIPEILAELRLQRRLRVQQLASYARQENGEHSNGEPPAKKELRVRACLETATHRFGSRYEQMYVDWLDELITELEQFS
jgi:PadR family transcriptional regulator, regulatory protein AphA